MDRKQQKIIARDTKVNAASCWADITRVTGAVIRHNTTTL